MLKVFRAAQQCFVEKVFIKELLSNLVLRESLRKKFVPSIPKNFCKISHRYIGTPEPQKKNLYIYN